MRRLLLVANRASLPQKWPTPPRNVADACELNETTEATQPSNFLKPFDTQVHKQPCALCHMEMSPCKVTWEFLERSSETWVAFPDKATADIEHVCCCRGSGNLHAPTPKLCRGTSLIRKRP